MEDTLGVEGESKVIFVSLVLILVLMEDTLGEKKNVIESLIKGLNPCFNGRYSRSSSLSATIDVGLTS